MGWKDAPISTPKWQSAPIAGGNSLGRQLGLTAKYAAEGLASLPNMVGDAANSAINLGSMGINSLTGADIPMLQMPSQVTSQLLTQTGLPNPETGTERVVGDVSRAMSGVGGANALGRLAPTAIQAVLNSNMGTQLASAITGSTSSGLTREVGGGPVAQTIAALVGGYAPVGAAQVAARGGTDLVRGIRNAAGSFTEGGQRQSVGKMLSRSANDPGMVINNLNNIPQYVPTSPVTTGEAAGDTGIAALQRGFRNQAGNPFSDIESQQNTARGKLLDQLAGSEADLKGLESSRGSSAQGLYDKAYNSGPVNSDRLQDFLATPELKAGISRGLKIQRLESIAAGEKFDPTDYSVTGFNEAGDPIIGKVPNVRLLDAGKKGIDAMITDNTDAVTGRVNELGRALTQFKSSYLKEIDSINPAYKEARSSFSDMSKPVNQARALQDLRSKVTSSAPDIQSGYSFLSQPKMTQALRDAELTQTLTPDQFGTLQNLEKDMVRSASLNARNIRPNGSDTAANESAKQVVASFLSDRALNKIPFGVGDFIKSQSKDKVSALMIEALKDPKLARSLLVELKPELQSVPYSGAMANKLLAQTIGSITAVNSVSRDKR